MPNLKKNLVKVVKISKTPDWRIKNNETRKKLA